MVVERFLRENYALVCSSSRAMLPTRERVFVFLKGFSMARGRKTSLTIRLTPAERQTLQAWQRATTTPAGLARRGRILSLLAARMPISAIASTVGISHRFVYKWVQRFVQEGLEGLLDKPRRHRRHVLPQSDLVDQRDMDAG